MTYYPAEPELNLAPVIMCNACGTWHDLTEANIAETRATWKTETTPRGDKKHYCPTCKEARK